MRGCARLAGCGLLFTLSLAAPSASAPAPAAGTGADSELLLRGALADRARIALPPEAVAFVELRVGTPAAAGAAETGVLLLEQRWATAGRQVPLSFALALPRAAFPAAGGVLLRGGILVDGRPTWISAPVVVDLGAASAELGTLPLQPAPAGAFATVFRCGEQRVAVGYNERELLLAIGAEVFPLRQAIAASGARYLALADSTTELWNKGEQFMVTLRGERLPECGIPAGSR
jgi:uncharacterized lipoprotein YbaY